MWVLGISAFYHDSAAALIKDGEIICAAHEERFTRKKHDDTFPEKAIDFCLKFANISISEIEAIVFYDKPFVKFERIMETYFNEVPYGFVQFAKSLPIWAKDKLLLKSKLIKSIKKLDSNFDSKKLLFTEHHYSHAASAFYPSPFEEATVLTIDGVGEWATSSISVGRGNKLEMLKEIHFPDSLGLFYSAFTQYCGFKVNSGEYKLMGLAPLGTPKYVDLIKDNLIQIHENGSFKLNKSYFNYTRGLSMINSRFEKLFGVKSRPLDSNQIDDFYKDIAASCQKVTEELVLKMANYAVSITGINKLCLAGGVALNCVANGKLLSSGKFERIWIQPAAGDAGGSVGAALGAYYLLNENKRVISNTDGMKQAYLGPNFSNEEIEAFLTSKSAVFQLLDKEDLLNKLAGYLQSGKIIGLFQGHMEFGPRALGNRSIIANPAIPEMQKQLNLKTKFREDFRPFAPVVRATDCTKYFDLTVESPYMLFTSQMNNPAQLTNLRSVVHKDGSARVQTVTEKSNSFLYNLLGEFEKVSGFGVLVNTSFNVRGEPMVCSPEDAWNCFMGSGIDVLVLENYILLKEEQHSEAQQDWASNFEAD